MKAKVIVTLKEDVNDAPGRELATQLRAFGYSEVTGARIGKIIEVELDSGDRDNAEGRFEDMCKKLLANSEIENYKILEID